MADEEQEKAPRKRPAREERMDTGSKKGHSKAAPRSLASRALFESILMYAYQR